MVMDSRSRKPLQRALMSVDAVDPITVVSATDYHWVDQSDPNANNGGGTRAVVSQDDSGAQEKIAIMKFERPVTSDDPAFSIILLRTIHEFTCQVTNDAATNLSDVKVFMDIYKITADFNAGAVTWNNYLSLSLTRIGGGDSIQRINGASLFPAELPIGTSFVDEANDNQGVDMALNNTVSWSWDFEDAYGMSLRFRVTDFAGSSGNKSAIADFRRSGLVKDSLLIGELP
ncbi:unnamed protein product [marine sediment metagenome]|uniref:Uncharacterized protein n=1 Tax=marine sediment metagenome TaxID=412755 RepID=X0XYY2_9ZZZZ